MREWTYEIVQDIRDGTGLWFIEGSEWEYSYDESGSSFRALSEISDFAGPFVTRGEAEAFASSLRYFDFQRTP
tara:strand:+ start:1898 stop:2116 length:219 start_codon:yes stop_codon:yes gene_type:complete